VTWVYVILAAVVFLFAGAGICMFGVAIWYMLKIVRELRAAIERLTKSTDELLGEGSFAGISKSLRILTGALPEIMGGMKEFSRTMGLIFRSAEPEKTQTMDVPMKDESAFYPGKTESEQAQDEVTAEARRQKLIISDEQFAGMHTDQE
jgi:hypothetical protein